jgi:hypothetical protein
VNRWIAPLAIAVVALAFGVSQFASASRLSVTPKDVGIYQLTTKPNVPKVLQVTASEDTWNDDQATNATHGTDVRLGIADSTSVCYVINNATCTTYRNARTYLKFDLSALPAGATVQSATVQLTGGPTTISATPLSLRRVTTAWTEAALTYNTRPSTSGSGAVTAAATTSGSTKVATFNVLSFVQNRATTSIANGFEIRPNGTTDSWWYSSEWGTASQRPTLTVIYQ